MASTLPALRPALALALLRITVGLIFLMHGWQKVFNYGFAGVTGSFTNMGIPLPGVMGPFVALLELVGGAALIVGFFTRIIGTLFMIEMIVAVLVVHLAAGFFMPNGYEFALLLCASSLALALSGGGEYSLDARSGRSPLR